MNPLTATEILSAIEAHHPRAAFVRELTVDDSALSAALSDLAIDATVDEMIAARKTPGSRRIDALMFDGLQRTAIEVKVSTADARRESWHKIGGN